MLWDTLQYIQFNTNTITGQKSNSRNRNLTYQMMSIDVILTGS